MRHINKLISLAFLLILATGVMSCLADDDDIARQEDAGTPVPLTLNITDGGYANSSATGTRAEEEGYATLFTDGDRIGVFVKTTLDGIPSYRSLPFTYRDAGGWTTSEEFYYNIHASYAAYYPYTATVVDQQSYDEYVTQFVPKDDQGIYANYTGSDLMTGTGIVGEVGADGKRTITITLTHQMSLVVVEMPKGKYISPTTDETMVYHPQALVSPPVTWSSRSKPYLTEQGTYRYLVKPSSIQKSLNGIYNNNGTNHITITLSSNVPQGRYKMYRVDKNIVINDQIRPLAVGDFYYANGSVLPGNTVNLPAGCIAVVYWLGNIAGDNYGLLNAQFPQGTHALAISLRNLINPRNPSTEYIDWTYDTIANATYISNWLSTVGWPSKPANFNSMVSQISPQGYANTFAMNEFNKTLGGFVDQTLTPIVALDTYTITVPTPSSSSGWYLPSVKDIGVVQWGSLESEALGRQILRAGGTWSDSQSYWTSTEYSEISVYIVNFYSNSYAGMNKNMQNKIRAVIAF